MGYDAYLIDEEVIYDEHKLEEFLRRIFAWNGSQGGDAGAYPAQMTSSQEGTEISVDDIYARVVALQNFLYSL
jgi:hypothetical protein